MGEKRVRRNVERKEERYPSWQPFKDWLLLSVTELGVKRGALFCLSPWKSAKRGRKKESNPSWQPLKDHCWIPSLELGVKRCVLFGSEERKGQRKEGTPADSV